MRERSCGVDGGSRTLEGRRWAGGGGRETVGGRRREGRRRRQAVGERRWEGGVAAVGGRYIPARLFSPVFSDKGAAYKRGAIDKVPEYEQAQKWKQRCGEVFEMYMKCRERAHTGAFRQPARCVSGPCRCLTGGHCIEPPLLDLHPICGADKLQRVWGGLFIDFIAKHGLAELVSTKKKSAC